MIISKSLVTFVTVTKIHTIETPNVNNQVWREEGEFLPLYPTSFHQSLPYFHSYDQINHTSHRSLLIK